MKFERDGHEFKAQYQGHNLWMIFRNQPIPDSWAPEQKYWLPDFSVIANKKSSADELYEKYIEKKNTMPTLAKHFETKARTLAQEQNVNADEVFGLLHCMAILLSTSLKIDNKIYRHKFRDGSILESNHLEKTLKEITT